MTAVFQPDFAPLMMILTFSTTAVRCFRLGGNGSIKNAIISRKTAPWQKIPGLEHLMLMKTESGILLKPQPPKPDGNRIKMAGGMFTQTEATQKMDGKPLMEKNTILIPPDIVILDGCILIKLIIISTSQPES